MGMADEFETSLQVLRGFDADISIEVNEIKVNSDLIPQELVTRHKYGLANFLSV